MAQITSITSESLQAQIRTLLPSQQGFGEDLQATNVITPIIDLTAAAQGTTTPESLQQAIAFGSQTAFRDSNSTTVLANTPGFYKIEGTSAISQASSAVNQISMTDGLSTKKVWAHEAAAASGNHAVLIDLIVFLRAGDSVSSQSNNPNTVIAGSIRQIADVNGNLVNPVGYTPQ